jgi:tripartite ATP-independent transporter DctM subunit
MPASRRVSAGQVQHDRVVKAVSYRQAFPTKPRVPGRRARARSPVLLPLFCGTNEAPALLIALEAGAAHDRTGISTLLWACRRRRCPGGPGARRGHGIDGYWRNRHIRFAVSASSRSEAYAAIREARWDLPLPIVVLGGIYSGYFAVSEAAAVTALYVLLIETVILREVSWRELPRIMRESMVLVGAILVILGVSLASTNYMIDTGVPQQLFAAVRDYVAGPTTFLLLLLVFLLILGAILDIFSATVLVVPLILPVAAQYGVNPIHLGIVFLAAMELGYLTPPVGLNLFIASHRFNKDITEIYWATQPFLLVSLIAVVIIAFWPGLSLMLLR